MKKTILTLLISIISITSSNSQVFEVIAGTGVSGYSGDGTNAINAELNYPRHLVFDGTGNLYFADENNHVIRKIDENGIISTIAGNGILGYSGDGSLATFSQLDNPRGICIDNIGNLLVADSGNNVIRKIDTNGIITTIAGNGSSGFSGDNGSATSAQLNSPRGVRTDVLGNIYIADTNNHRVRKIETNGIITTIAGNGTNGSFGDGGQAINASLETPYDINVKNGTIYIADIGGGSIRKINSLGIISTILNDDLIHIIGSPTAINFDNDNNLFVSDLNGAIFKIDALENTTLIFDNIIGNAGGIAFDMNFNLYYSDTFANQIKKIANSTLSANDISFGSSVKVFPNPAQDNIHIDISDSLEIENISLYDSNGKLLKTNDRNSLSFSKNKNVIKVPLKNSGIYFIKIKSKQGIITKKIIKF